MAPLLVLRESTPFINRLHVPLPTAQPWPTNPSSGAVSLRQERQQQRLRFRSCCRLSPGTGLQSHCAVIHAERMQIVHSQPAPS